MNMRDLEIMIQEIRDAFGDMPYPGTEYLTNDLEGNDLERKQIREGFSRYENWQDVPRELLVQERDALPLFEPQGFRFYLPAYMLFALEDYEGADMIPESIVHSLTLPDAERSYTSLYGKGWCCSVRNRGRLYYTFWNIWNDAMRKILRIYVWAIGVRLLHAGRLKDGADLLLTKYKIYEP